MAEISGPHKDEWAIGMNNKVVDFRFPTCHWRLFLVIAKRAQLVLSNAGPVLVDRETAYASQKSTIYR